MTLSFLKPRFAWKNLVQTGTDSPPVDVFNE